MPWVLDNFTSKTLNLHEEEMYRDLSKPIGALLEHRREQIIERFELSGQKNPLPPFHWGTHYSS
eukprot:CAMPEP_0114986884 /NCGR_PEP_ID=MMETSP0216-20121206/8679_1 /TAXON_ID=223996 /ORGANISM="Protocruzia adherens, Strain Boccale" /LENGTH=63 /DNA_ID=CAMNT_0002349379 /DNA_START=77 /DNA_END=264 /DNA_ORIENTATION=+